MKDTEKRRILIIEDDKHIAQGLQLSLSLQGYETEIAGNGTLGLRLWKEWNPQLIVLDIMLPGLDGLSVLRHIRVASKQELKDRIMAAVDYFNDDPVVHTGPTSSTRPHMIRTLETLT